MNLESNRLNTFTNWPTSAPVDPIRIAKAGFYYTGEGTEVQCFSCGGKISQWDYGDQVMWRHRRLKPTCAFVVNPQLSGNVPLVLGSECPSLVENSISSTERDNEQNDSLEPSQDYGVTEVDEMYRNNSLRQLSFSNWDDPSVSREALVGAGFYHVGEGRLRCAWCGGELAPFRNFGSLGPPLQVHRMYFPGCEHAASIEAAQNNITISSSGVESSDSTPVQSPPENTDSESQTSGAAHNSRLLSGGAGGTWRALGVVGGGARHAAYASLAARLATFQRWPADRHQAPRALAEAGFFHTGTDDQVRCFYCDGGLGRWEADDAPWAEHARWFPHCGYVLLVRGPDYVEACRATPASPATSANSSPTPAVQRTFSAESGLSSRRRNPGVNFPVTESQVSECMESAVAMSALGAGLDAARVRRALARRLRATGLPFNSSEALIDAVLDEQLNEEAWSVSSHSQRLARDILAETFRDFAPSLTPPTSWDTSRPASRRSESEIPVRSPSPVEPTEDDNQPGETDRLDSRENVEQVDASVIEEVAEEKSSNTPTIESNKKQLTLEEENRQLKEARLCKVCMDSEVSVVFLPCGHLVSCARCGAALAACPLCRAHVRALVRAYLA